MVKFAALLVTLCFVSALQARPDNTINSFSDNQQQESLTARQDRLESLLEQALNRIAQLEDRQSAPQNKGENNIEHQDLDVPISRAAAGLPLPTSCADVFQNGHYLNNFFMVKGSNGKIETVFCDFRNSTGQVETRMGYLDVKTFPIHFYVQRDSSFSGTQSALTWSRSLLNTGNAMNLGTGVFTAPRAGTYHFAFSGVKSYGTGGLYIYIRLNGNVVGTSESGTSSVVLYENISLHSTLPLKKGDTIDLRITGQLYDPLDGNAHRTHFTGWLIEEDLVL